MTTFTKLSKEQLSQKIKFIEQYMQAKNAADGSVLDANANVEKMNIATLSSEIHKDINIQINRRLMWESIKKEFDEETADEYIRQLVSHEIYKHDETSNSPYTYASTESVLVDVDDETLLVPMNGLYELSDAPEYLEDDDKEVYVKYPKNISIIDRKGSTKITRLVKKKRHRDLYRVKTSFGEDIFVTDNHPMIISDNKNDTVTASDSKGHMQYRSDFIQDFKGKTVLKVLEGFDLEMEDYGSYIRFSGEKHFNYKYLKKEIEMTEEFGYFIGMFIAAGTYNRSCIQIIQTDKKLLVELSDILYRHTGVGSVVKEKLHPPSHVGRKKMYTLSVLSPCLEYFFKEYLGINQLSQNKNIPSNIYEFSKDFAKGILAGLLDGDGSVSPNGSISLRLSSRTLISQMSFLLKSLGYSVSNIYSDRVPKETDLIKQSFPIFGVQFYKKPESVELPLSFKMKLVSTKYKSPKYKDNGWVNILDSKKIVNKHYLQLNEYIYDITTESNTFICNNLWVHNCVSISMYPFLMHGLRTLGGESGPPKHTNSFCGSFVNLIYAISSQFAGACLVDDQRLMFKQSDKTFAPRIGTFVDSYKMTNSFENLQGTWEYCHVNDLQVWEDGKYVKVNKLYKRRYKDLIYTVKTASGKRVRTSKDHIYKVLFKNREIEVKALDLAMGDTVYNTNHVLYEFDRTSKEYSNGQIMGLSIVNNPNFNDGELIPELEGGDLKHINVENKSLDYLLGFLDGFISLHCFWNNNYELEFKCGRLAENVKDIMEMIGFHLEIEKKNNLFHLNIPNQVSPYLDLTLDVLKENKEFLETNSKPLYYAGNSAFESTRALNSDSKYEIIGDFHLDVIISIETEEIDSYIYELETETHWYSAGGILTHNCASVEFLMYLDYFLLKDYGDDYLNTHTHEVENHLQHVIYALNQPASARGYQCVFWNISIFDRFYFESLFEHFVFPDMTKPGWGSLDRLQRFFMKWFRKEREKVILTFPVVTAALLTDGDEPRDKEYSEFLSDELSKSNSFFIYMSKSADSLASCCRLRNELQDNTFSYSLGAGGVATGSISVITLNMNRLVQDGRDLKTEIQKIHKYQYSYRKIVEGYLKAGMLPVYDAGFINLDKQFLTIGINGMVEAAESLGISPTNNDDYKEFITEKLKIIYDANKEAKKKYKIMFNTEFVPAENLGVKFANWDREATKKVYTIEVEGKEIELKEATKLVLKDGRRISPKDLKVGDDIEELALASKNIFTKHLT